MRLRAAADWMRLAAALMLAVVTASFAVAHAPRLQTAPTDLLLLALPDGSLPELCAAGHGERPDQAPARHELCLTVCLVALAAAPLPAPPVLAAPVATAWRPAALPGAGDAPRSFRAAAQARAPPSLG